MVNLELREVVEVVLEILVSYTSKSILYNDIT